MWICDPKTKQMTHNKTIDPSWPIPGAWISSTSCRYCAISTSGRTRLDWAWLGTDWQSNRVKFETNMLKHSQIPVQELINFEMHMFSMNWMQAIRFSTNAKANLVVQIPYHLKSKIRVTFCIILCPSLSVPCGPPMFQRCRRLLSTDQLRLDHGSFQETLWNGHSRSAVTKNESVFSVCL